MLQRYSIGVYRDTRENIKLRIPILDGLARVIIHCIETLANDMVWGLQYHRFGNNAEVIFSQSRRKSNKEGNRKGTPAAPKISSIHFVLQGTGGERISHER